MFFKKKKGIKIINDGIFTHLIIDGKDISQYVLSYKTEQKGGEKPKLLVEISTSKIDIITNELPEIEIKNVK